MIFEGNDLLVTDRLSDRLDILVVTFTGRDTNPPAPAGAAEGFFARNRVSAVHFISKANHWWETDELKPALALVKEMAQSKGYRQIVTFGSSMGGHGALISAARLGACRAVVSVPQYSINREIVPWEERWQKDAKRIQFRDEPFGEQLGACDVTILLDPFFDADRRHAELIATHRPVQQIQVGFAEHDVSRVLSDLDMLRDVTLDAVFGRFDAPGFRARYRQHRATSPLVWIGAARLLARRGKPGEAERHSRRAFNLLMSAPPAKAKPEHDRLLISHIEHLLTRAAFADALTDLDRWQTLKTPGVHEFRLRAAAHAGLGEGEAALKQVLRAARARRPDRALQNQLMAALGRFADSEQTRAVVAEFEATLIGSSSTARRAAELLGAKGLAAEASRLAREASERFPKEQSRLAKLVLPLPAG